MKRNELKDSVDHQAIRQLENRELLNQGDDGAANDTCDKALLETCELLNQGDNGAANDNCDKAFLEICKLLNQVDLEAAGDTFEEDFSDIIKLRSGFRKELLQGRCWIAVGVCLILASFAIVTP